MLWVLFYSILAFAAVKCELDRLFVICGCLLLSILALKVNNSTTDTGLLDLKQST